MIADTSKQDLPVSAPTRKPFKRLLLWGGLGLGFLFLAFLLLSARSANLKSVSESRIRLATVSRGNLVRDAAVNGRIVAAISPTLYSTAAGTVTLRVNAGDTVRKGDILAEVDSPDITDQFKREQSTWDQLEADLARQQIVARKQKLLARRDADQAEIERATAELTLQRIDKAGGLGVISKNEYLKAQDALRSAEIRSKHASAAAELENDDVALQIKTRQSQLQRQRLVLENARRRVEELQIRSPINGIVGSLAIVNRSVVAANAPLMTLVDLALLEVEVDIPESYVADLGLGLNAEISIGDNKLAGKLTALSPEVIKNQVLARVRFDGTQPVGLRQSQRVSVRLLIEEKPNVLLAPRGPFVEHEGGKFAYVVHDGVAERRAIRLGATSITAVEIIDGLNVGDQIVIAGTESFDHAERISIKP